MEARHFNIGCGEALIGEEKWRRPTTRSIDSSFGEEDLRFAFCEEERRTQDKSIVYLLYF